MTFNLLIRLLTVALAAVLGLGAPALHAQQNLFAPRLIINDKVISEYEINQRVLFLQLLRAPGNPQDEALDGLIEDRLRADAAKEMDISATEEQIAAGMGEFASRANLSTEEFLKAIAAGGVEPQTFRDFVRAGLVWRDVVRARFAPRVQITDVQVDRAIAGMTRASAVRVLLSEIIIPAEPGNEAQAMALATRIQAEVSSDAGFAAAARQYSASGSAASGGKIEWLPLANLPPAIAPFVLALAPGEVSDPVAIPNAVAIFQLRAVEETEATAPTSVEVEYAQFFLPDDDRAAAAFAKVRAEVDTCDDLYTVAKGLPETQLQRDTQAMGAVPQDIALQLARLDEGESSTALVFGGNRVFLMLCARRPQMETPPSREEVRQQLFNQRLAAMADGYLADLRANAIIREP